MTQTVEPQERARIPLNAIERLAARYGIVVVLLIVLAVYLLALTPHIGPFDSAYYLILARSIATGQGYRDLHQVGTPPHTHFPFGFPLLLSPVWLLFPSFPDNALAFKSVPVFFTVAAWAVLYLFLRRQGDLSPSFILGLLLLSGLTPLALFFASQELMSETSYMFFSFLALWLFERVAEGHSSRMPAFMVAVLALVMSYFVRTVGLSLLLSVVLYFAWKRDLKRAVLIVALFALLISPWLYRNWAVGTSPLSGDYGPTVLLKDYARPDLGYIESYWDFVLRVFRHGWVHITDSLLWIFLPQLALERPVSLPAFLYQGWLKALISLALAGLIAWGLVTSCWRRKGITLPVLYVVIYLGPVLLQPWVGARNLIPIAPFLFYYFVLGLRAILPGGKVMLGRFTPPVTQVATWGVVLVLLISFARSDRWDIRQGLASRSGAYADPAEQSFAEACRWVAANTSEGARFFTALPAWFYLYTGRRVTACRRPEVDEGSPEVKPSEEQFLSCLLNAKIDYVVLQPERPSYDGGVYDQGENPLYNRMALSFPEHFVLRYKSTVWPETLVYEVIKAGGP